MDQIKLRHVVRVPQKKRIVIRTGLMLATIRRSKRSMSHPLSSLGSLLRIFRAVPHQIDRIRIRKLEGDREQVDILVLDRIAGFFKPVIHLGLERAPARCVFKAARF